MKFFIHITFFILLCMNEYTFVNAMPTEESAQRTQSSKKLSRDDERNNDNEPSAKEQLSEECPICYEVMDTRNTEQPLRNLSCNHIFHCKCINWWLRPYHHNTCPLCRTLQLEILSQKLFDAVKMDNVTAITILLDQGANVDAKNQEDFTALHSAAVIGNVKVAELLLNNHANINAQTHKGKTALYLAAQFCHINVATLLLDRGADTTKQNNNNETALDIAQRMNNPKMIQLLTQATTPN